MVSILLGLCCLLSDKMPYPEASQLRRAEALVQEVYGAEIAKAKLPQAKSKLAQDILKTAREEQDGAVRFAALQAARRLAVEALDGKLGLEIIREIVQTYEPLESMPAEERLAEAERLWKQAEKAQGREKLAKQLEALEQWLYCDVASGLIGQKWAARQTELLTNYALTPEEKQLAQWAHGKTVALIHVKSGLSLNIRGRSPKSIKDDPNAYAILYPDPKAHPNALWKCFTTPSGGVRFQNIFSGLWLGVYDHKEIPDVAAQVEESQASIWLLKIVSNKTVLVVHVQTGLCLRPWNGETKPGFGVHLYPISTDDSYHWYLQPLR